MPMMFALLLIFRVQWKHFLARCFYWSSESVVFTARCTKYCSAVTSTATDYKNHPNRK